MTVQQIQWAIASVFLVLGGWALLAPQSVIDLTLLPAYREGTPILPFVVACFGSQALLSGLFVAFTRFTPTTFLAYGVALVPFFAFNAWFSFIEPVFTWVGLVDALGNAVMLALCVVGWRRAKEEAAG